jgi:hypothetical protein
MSVSVDLEAIRSLADDFRAAADVLSQQVGTFGHHAELNPDAFGTLPAGRQAYADYAEKLQLSLGSLRRLRTTLLDFAGNLETSAANWEQADQGSTPGSP